MFEKLTEFMEVKLAEPMAKLAAQRHLVAIRNGIIGTLPLIIVGSFFLIFAFPPIPQDWEIYKYLSSHAADILLPYRMTMFIMSLYAVFGVGYHLSKSYRLDGITGAVLSEIAFLLTLKPVAIAPELAEKAGVAGFVMPMGNLGGGGLFVGIIVAFIAVELYRFCDTKGFKIRMPEQVPPAVAKSFEALTPTVFVIFLMSFITYFLGFDWHGFIAKIMTPLIKGSDSLPSVLLLIFLVTFFWSFGIHGMSIIGSLARPLWLTLLEANTTAIANGEKLPHVAAEPFFQWFIWVGGAGCTIGLVLLMAFFSKSSFGKSFGRTALLPSIFNINEPVIFGCPIVLNPVFMIPFMVAPMVCATVAWFATKLGLVTAVSVTAPWTLPGPIGAYLATGGDIRASILCVVCIGISIVVYYPFFKMNDTRQLEIEKESK